MRLQKFAVPVKDSWKIKKRKQRVQDQKCAKIAGWYVASTLLLRWCAKTLKFVRTCKM